MTSLKVDSSRFGEALPTLPGQILRALDEIEKTSALDYNILRLVQNDASIALSVLKVANAPIYGYSAKVASLQQAVGLLGPQAIKNIILTTPIYERFGTGSVESQVDLLKLWMHSTVTACLAGVIGRKQDDLEQDVCFTAGLIYDAGKIALAVYYREQTQKILALAERKKWSLVQASREVLEFSYPEIMVAMTEHWNLPSPLYCVFKNHCVLDKEHVEDKLTGVVCLAKCLAFQFGYPDGLEKVKPLVSASLLKLLSLTEKDLQSWEPMLREQAALALESYED